MIFSFVFLISTSLLAGFNAQAQTTDFTCNWSGHDCNGTNDSPMDSRGGRSRGAADATEGAYRYGKIKEYEDYREHLKQIITDHHEKIKAVGKDQDDLAEMSRAAQHELDHLPPLPKDLADESARRQMNPIPPGFSQADVKAILDPLWTDIHAADPFKLERDVSRALAYLSVTKDQDGQFLLKELTLSKIITGDGILRLPSTNTPVSRLEAELSTPVGMDFRININRALVGQSAIGQVCESQPGARDACEQWTGRLNEAISGIYILDRLVAMNGGQFNQVTQLAYDNLRTTIAFGYGVAKGVVEGGIGFFEGTYQVLTSPIKSARDLALAVYNYRTTLPVLKNGALGLCEELKTGSAERRGEIIGRAVFEIASAIEPFTKVGPVAGITQFGKAVAVEALARAAETGRLASVVTPFEIRASFAASHLGLAGKEAAEFVSWTQKYLRGADAENLLITMARRVSPERFQLLREVQTALGESVGQATHEYIVRQLIYEKSILKNGTAFTAEDLHRIARKADFIDQALKDAKGITAPAGGIAVTRSTGLYYTDKFSRNAMNTIEKMMEANEGGTNASFRYSMPGEPAVYVVEGVGEKATEVSIKEIGREIGGPHILTTTDLLQPKKMLVLDPAELTRLGTNIDGVTLKQYELTQMIGYYAKRHGFDAMKAPSGVDSKFYNIIILKH